MSCNVTATLDLKTLLDSQAKLIEACWTAPISTRLALQYRLRDFEVYLPTKEFGSKDKEVSKTKLD